MKIVKLFAATLAVVSMMTTSVSANTGDKIAKAFAVSPNHPATDSHFVEQAVIDYFRDIPVMIAIASCESEFRQYKEDGQLLVNPSPKSTASGVYQILYTTHKKSWSKSPETNITTLDGNLEFARKMYEESGTAPWKGSQDCWKGRINRYQQRVASLKP